MNHARESRLLLRRHRSGILSTHSAKHAGYPYGSALPHVTDHAGRPVVLISHLAEHTHNIEADPRVSFIVCASGPDLQSAPRVTVVGDARALDENDGIAARYLRLYPAHDQYLQIGGFRFYAIEPHHIRLIQGFGGLHWLGGESILAVPGLAEAEAGILEHMNADHADALRDYARTCGADVSQAVTMVGIDCDGFDLRCEDTLLRVDFDEPANTPADVRNALIELARRARAA